MVQGPFNTIFHQNLQRFSDQIKPTIHSQLKSYMRPEEIPTGADKYYTGTDTFGYETEDEDVRRERAEQEKARRQAGLAPNSTSTSAYGSPVGHSNAGSNTSLAGSPSQIGGNLFSAPEARAAMGSVARATVDRALDVGYEEAPRFANDLGNEEYKKKRDERRQKDQAVAECSNRIYY